MVEKSQADTLRDHLNLKLDQKFDFSQTSNVTADIKSFCEANSSRKWTEPSVRASYNRLLQQLAKNRNITLEHLGKKTKRPKFNKKLQAAITPKPVGKLDSQQTEQAQTTQAPPRMGADGKPIQQIANWENFDSEGVAATFNALFLSIRIAYPELEALTKEEKDSLGKMWLPAFQRYLTENWAYIGIPLIATFGMMTPKIAAARKLHKKNKEIAQVTPETIKATAEQKDRKERKIVCPDCRTEFNSFVALRDHKRVCPKKPKKLSA